MIWFLERLATMQPYDACAVIALCGLLIFAACMVLGSLAEVLKDYADKRRFAARIRRIVEGR